MINDNITRYTLLIIYEFDLITSLIPLFKKYVLDNKVKINKKKLAIIVIRATSKKSNPSLCQYETVIKFKTKVANPHIIPAVSID
ncbi:MAG: hypothetical protein Q4C98_08675 [Capnocytophaga sp.]|nr:hypothetical protein [Capnocytophaga sp.]